MRNFKNNRRRFRGNSFDRATKLTSNEQSLNSTIGNVSDFRKKHHHKNNFNSVKLIQKYTDLAREAFSSGDKILYENYMQHAEHFVRVNENSTNINNSKNKSSDLLKDSNISKIVEKNLDQEDQL